jgi:hypothetical protein
MAKEQQIRKMTMRKKNTFKRAFSVNNIDPFIPEWWANETLAILEEEMVAANLVHRDFEPMFQKYGDIVNTRRPSEFVGKRKTTADAITVQNATATNVAVPLDQHCHVAFDIKDAERSMSMKVLQDQYARPAAIALARQIDRIVLGQYPQFMLNNAGKLNLMTESTVKGDILDLRLKLDNNKCYDDGRNLVLSPTTEATVLKPEWFTSADKVGDSGTALRTASLGQKFGLNFYKALNMGYVTAGNTTRTFQVNNSGGYAAGVASSLTVDTGTGEILNGTWVSIGGIPYRVTAHTGTAPTTAITLDRALQVAIADNDAITVYTPGAVNNGGGYAAGYSKEITVDGFTVAPRVGQFITFGTTAELYTIIDVNGLVGITLDRPLAASVADDATVNIGPAGAYNLAFHKNAMTLAVRPLAPVLPGTGASSATVSINGLTLRVTIGYDITYQRTIWVFDFLAGIKVLDTNLGAVLLG